MPKHVAVLLKTCISCIVLCALVGGCADCKNMHGVDNGGCADCKNMHGVDNGGCADCKNMHGVDNTKCTVGPRNVIFTSNRY